MFKSLRHWLDELAERGRLFADDDEAVHTALASVLYHVIRADTRESAREKAKFEHILTREFGIDHAEVERLHRNVQTFQSDLRTDLETLKAHLKDNPNVRMALMRKLNQLVALEGVDAREVAVFNQAVAAMFPQLEDVDQSGGN